MDDNIRYKVADIPVEGIVTEMGELTSWGDQGGKLRNLVVEVTGVFGPALVPLTVFGDDAVYLDPTRDVGRRAKCTGRLTSRRYISASGNQRWALSITARGLILSDAAANVSGDPAGAKALSSTLESYTEDDIPF